MPRLIVTGCLIAAVAAATPLSAKGPTVRLVVTGGTLGSPITIADVSSLSAFSVYGGEFLGAAAAPNDAQTPRYEVSFYVELPRGGGIHKKYVVHYTKGAKPGEGYIYLPGRGDESYRLNSATILRAGHDGQWHAASRAWSKMLEGYLP